MNFVKSYRNPEAYTLIKKHRPSFLLFYYIGHHVRRTPDKINNLEIGEVKLGKELARGMIGLTEMEYRIAKKNLEKFGFCIFKTSNRGTIGKLINTSIFDPNFQLGNEVTTNSNQDQNWNRDNDETITNPGSGEENQYNDIYHSQKADSEQSEIKPETPNNNEKNEKKKMINEYETQKNGETTLPQKKQKKQKLTDQEQILIEDILEWAYDPHNKFGIDKSIEETKEHITNTIKKYGFEKINSIFEDSKSREPWNYQESDLSAYSQFWNQVKRLKDIDRIENNIELIERESKIINYLEKRTNKQFKKNGNLNLKRLLNNKISNNDISRYITWFLDKNHFKKDNSVLDKVSLDSIFAPELWIKYLKQIER